jgi:chromosome segregation ATPase
MTAAHRLLVYTVLIGVVLMGGCVNDNTELKQKVAELEKRIAKQQKDLGEFAGKFAPPKDFSADIQRLEDQQDRISQLIKNKVDPINMKLEEFRDWAQESVKERGKVAETLKRFQNSIAKLNKGLEAQARKGDRRIRALASHKKTIVANERAIESLKKSVTQLRRDVLENNTKLVTALKKTLPKVKKAAVAEVKNRLVSLDRGLKSLRSETEAKLKKIETVKQPPRTDYGADVQAMRKKINDLEEIIAAQKSTLLEMGSKIHRLETTLGGR